MLKILKRLSKVDVIAFIGCFVLTSLQVWLELRIPDYMSEITKLVQTAGSEMSDILYQGGHMLVCAFASLLCAVISIFFASFVSSSFSRKLRREVFESVEGFGMEEIKAFSTSSLITRTTNDITQIEVLISMGMHGMIRSPIMCVLAISKIIGKSQEWTMLTGMGVLIILFFVGILMAIVIPKFKLIQKYVDELNGVTRENLTGIRVVRAFNAEKFQKKRFEKVNSDLTNLQLFNQRCFAFMSPIMYMVMHGLTLGIYIIGAILISKATMFDRLTIFSNMVVFSSYAMQVIMSFLMLAITFMILPRAQVSANRINEVLETESSIKDGKGVKHTKETGTVEFKNVSFKYPDADEYLIRNISFKVNKGETIAFIGSTGSGKSTLINLVPRFYDVTDGEILVDGVNVKDYTLSELHNKLGYVSQKAFMFNGTVFDNVAYGDNGKDKITKGKVEKAIEIAQADDFVSEMEGGIDGHVARGGTNVSGGQKQRLAIARAIARDPEIYIFDDSFSALDYKTDSTLRKELKEYTKDATSLIVAQRIGTILNADKIIVLDKGECVGIGTHKELMEKCEIYKEIALSQLSEEELSNAW